MFSDLYCRAKEHAEIGVRHFHLARLMTRTSAELDISSGLV